MENLIVVIDYMKSLILHLIATIKYRFDHAIGQANDSYPDFSIGEDIRTPLEILHHMRGLMYYSIKVLSGTKTPMNNTDDWDKELDLFYKSLTKLQLQIENNEAREDQYLKLTQGPLADALTHIGQLAMLSRANGRPIEKQNFVHAEIGFKGHASKVTE